MPVLTAIDVVGVQKYVFSSNRLRDVVAASWLVETSTNIEKGMLEDYSNQVLMAGGGNAILEFNDLEEAKQFAAGYSRKLHDQIPGLEYVIVHHEYKSGDVANAMKLLQIDIARGKMVRTGTADSLGIGVTAECAETGMSAAGFDPSSNTIPLSRKILKQREVIEDANKKWLTYLGGKGEFDFPKELDDLGRSINESSYIGVVHIDGNGIGQRIIDWLDKKIEKQATDEVLKKEYKKWSQSIHDLGKTVLEKIVNQICKSVEKTEKTCVLKDRHSNLTIELQRNDKKWMLPIRPVLLGGDDLTFICDGRIALTLTETALSVFEASKIDLLGEENIGACAGVALVHSHTPFSRSYLLAEKLCASAKNYLKSNSIENYTSSCALDWHIGLCKPSDNVDDIRARQYDSGKLTCRPYPLGSINQKETISWRWLNQKLLGNCEDGFRGPLWSCRRNKVKAFAEIVRQGPVGVKLMMDSWRVLDRELSLPQPIEQNGFNGKRTPLLDAAELLNLHLSLSREE